MKKYIILSTNENPEYHFYYPLVTWAWRKFGWTPITITVGQNMPDILLESFSMVEAPVFPGYETETIAQVARLFAAGIFPANEDDIFMTGDIDMLPLSDYWKPDPKEITAYGHDLTGFQHYPICYVAMNQQNWVQIMCYTKTWQENLKRALDGLENAKSSAEPVKRWVVDQDLLTDRLNSVEFPIKKIPRGTLPNGYPIGRVDRSAWTLEHEVFIDAHLHRGIWRDPARLDQTLNLLAKIWPGENFRWFSEYTADFNKRYGKV